MQLTQQLAELASIPGELSPGQAERHENLVRGIARIDERINALQTTRSPTQGERLARLKAINGSMPAGPAGASPLRSLRRVDPYADVDRLASLDDSSVRSKAMKAVDSWDAPTEAKFSAASLLSSWRNDANTRSIAETILLTSDPRYVRAFEIYFRSAASQDTPEAHIPAECQQMWREVNSRAMSEGTTAAGLALVPAMLDAAIIAIGAGAQNPFRALCDVRTITTRTWTGVTSADLVVSYTSGASESTDASPTLTQPSITPVQLSAYIPVSEELLADSEVMTSIGTLITQGRDILEATSFVTGAGTTSAPQGIATALDLQTSSRVSSTTSGQLGVVDCYSALDSLSARYRDGAAWVANQATWDSLRQKANPLANAVDPQPWREFAGTARPKLVGHEAWAASGMATQTASADVAIIGNWGMGAKVVDVVDVVGMGMQVHPLIGSNGRPTGQSSLYFTWRSAFGVVNTSAFVMVRC